MDISFITNELHDLRSRFNQRGFDLRLVGGVVRDTIAGIPCKDIDLCTDATPEQQIEIYQANGDRWIGTGMDHGTITVVLNNVPYEITSLRVDTETNGRHAKVAYTTDWEADLARRDLTINAMAMTFDGTLIDPFNGKDDLAKGRIVFVGNAEDRIKEDYLRILRWFRFQGRFGYTDAIDDSTLLAINKHASGLRKISKERVWSEIKRIVQHSQGPMLINEMMMMGINRHIGFDYWNYSGCIAAQQWTMSPELLIGAGSDWQIKVIDNVASTWKWSNAEREHVSWVAAHAFRNCDLRRLIAVDNAPREWVGELAALEGRDDWSKNALVHWHFDPFPVSGNDLVAAGMKQGKEVGQTLTKLKNLWADSGFVATKEELMKAV